MQAEKQRQSRRPSFREFNFETLEAVNCSQIKESLDELFSGGFLLEDLDFGAKQVLFGHLQTCSDCCRSFDVRIRLRPIGHNAIY